MYSKKHNRLLLGCGIAVCLLIAVTSLCLGNVHFTPVQLISLFRGQGDKVSRRDFCIPARRNEAHCSPSYFSGKCEMLPVMRYRKGICTNRLQSAILYGS